MGVYQPGQQAGLFSAVTSAFIIEVDPQLQPNSNDDTAALLRVLIYKIDNTSFGNDVPTIPQWAGPPHAIVQVQAILFASLTASLFSAFLAMLGKQWLNRYDSTEMRGTAIERSQNRQRKLNGIVTWYFRYVMESLPLMLQAALLLLDCALSRYLWEVNAIVASVVIGVTSFGVICYLFICVAGASFESCPYQTPGASAFRFIVSYARHHLPTLHPASISSKLSHFTQDSHCRFLLIKLRRKFHPPWYSIDNIASLSLLLSIPIAIARDAYLLCRGILRQLVGFGWRVCRQWSSVFGSTHWSLMSFGETRYRWFTDTPQARSLDRHAVTLDLQCVSWILQTSLDKVVHLAALKHLITMPELAQFDPTLVLGCFNVLVNCIGVSDRRVVTTRGLEELAALSAGCFLRTFVHLLTTDPTSSTLANMRKRYHRAFPSMMDFAGLPFRSTMNKIHILFNGLLISRLSRDDGTPPALERVPFSRDVVDSAWTECQRTRRRKVPRRFLHFVLHSLSMDPPPPVSVVVDCLRIVAFDLGCDPSDIAALGSRYLHPVPTIIYLPSLTKR